MVSLGYHANASATVNVESCVDLYRAFSWEADYESERLPDENSAMLAAVPGFAEVVAALSLPAETPRAPVLLSAERVDLGSVTRPLVAGEFIDVFDGLRHVGTGYVASVSETTASIEPRVGDAFRAGHVGQARKRLWLSTLAVAAVARTTEVDEDAEVNPGLNVTYLSRPSGSGWTVGSTLDLMGSSRAPWGSLGVRGGYTLDVSQAWQANVLLGGGVLYVSESAGPTGTYQRAAVHAAATARLWRKLGRGWGLGVELERIESQQISHWWAFEDPTGPEPPSFDPTGFAVRLGLVMGN